MGPVSATVYALLSVIAYSWWIVKIHKSKRTDNIWLPFFVLMFVAITVRIATVGFIISETMSYTAIMLEVTEIAVWLGLFVIACQIVIYRKQGR